MYKRVVVTGSIAYDHIMSMPGKFSEHIMPDKIHMLNVSFIMETFRKSFGGTGGNIAYTLGLLDIPVLLVGSVGNDFKSYSDHLKQIKKINTSGIKIFPKEPTALGFVVTDRDDNQIWGFYQGAMKYANKINLSNYVRSGDFLVIAPDNPTAMLQYANLAIKRKIPFMFDPAFNIPHFSIKDLANIIKHCQVLIGNDYEINLICKRLGIKENKLTKKNQILITTLGEKGSKFYSADQVITIPPARPINTSDPTGAGDAYRAGFLGGYSKDLSLDICGRMGSITAVYTVEKYGTQTHKFSIKQLSKRYQNNFSQKLTI